MKLPAPFFGITIAVTADSKTAYVLGSSKIGGPGKVIPISTATNTAGKAITTTGNEALAIAFTPGKQTAYIVSLGTSAGAPSGVTPINTLTNTAGNAIRVSPHRTDIAITP